VPKTGSASFQYSAEDPEWDAVKGGWYKGANRAVAVLDYSGGAYIVVLLKNT
jgi:hypothetical protein